MHQRPTSTELTSDVPVEHVQMKRCCLIAAIVVALRLLILCLNTRFQDFSLLRFAGSGLFSRRMSTALLEVLLLCFWQIGGWQTVFPSWRWRWRRMTRE